MEENQLSKAIAIVYDGTGYGDDGTLWGSEVLLVENADYQPWRLAASLLQIDQAERFFERGRNIALLGAKGRFPLA